MSSGQPDLTPDENPVIIDVEGSDALGDHFESAPREVPAAVYRVEVERLRAENDASIARLASQGISIQVPSVDMLKFAVLLDMVFGDESASARQAYELRVQLIIAEQLSNADGQAARAKLTAPGVPGVPHQTRGGRGNGLPPGLIMPGR